MNSNVLIIAGMHRSGTSLVTQWLYRCGLHVGNELLGEGIGNADGHYEDLEFYELHRNALLSQDLTDDGFTEKPVLELTNEQKVIANSIISEKDSNYGSWGWKDPRTCLFLQDYNKLIPKAKYLVVFRDFHSTVSSLISRTYKVIHEHDEPVDNPGFFMRYKLKRKKAKEIKNLCRSEASRFLKIWILYNREILKLIENKSRENYLVLNYETLIHRDQEVFSQLTEAWNFSLQFVSFMNIFKPALISKNLPVDRYVDKTLYNEAYQLQETLSRMSR